MGKEAKVGLSVIVVLVLCLGGVIAKRIMLPSQSQQAATTEDPVPVKDKEGKTSNAKAIPQLQQSGTAAKPTVVAAKPVSGQAAKSSPLDVGHWNTAGDRAKHAAGDAVAKSASPSYMPKSRLPQQVDPNDRYAANYTPPRTAQTGEAGMAAVGTTEVGAADVGVAGVADAGSEPYDPFQRYENRRATAAAEQNASAGTLKVIPPAGSTGARATGTATTAAKSGPAIQAHASRDAAARGLPMNRSAADHGAPVDPYAGRYTAQSDYGAAESRYAASHGAVGYAESGYAATAQASGRTSTSYTPGASGYSAARPLPSYGSPNRVDAGYGSGYSANGYNVRRDPRRDDGTYEVQPNDSYWTISQKCYGTGAYFKALAEVNRKKIPQEDQLKVGAIVAAPDVAQLERQYPKLCPKPSRREVVKHGTTQVSTSAHLSGARTYVSQEGDTLYEVARTELGKASRWVEIYELNREQIGPDYDYLPAGLHLSLPGKEPTDSVTRRPSHGPELRYQR